MADQGRRQQQALFRLGEESNSKKRISWGGIHVRCFNDQENKNWDVSPQSLLSGSDRSRSIEVGSNSDPNHNNNINNTGIDDQYLFSNGRLSEFFGPKTAPTPIAQAAEEAAAVFASNILKNQHTANSNTGFAQNFENSKEDSENGSFLLDDIDRLSRLSGLFKEFDDEPKKEVASKNNANYQRDQNGQNEQNIQNSNKNQGNQNGRLLVNHNDLGNYREGAMQQIPLNNGGRVKQGQNADISQGNVLNIFERGDGAQKSQHVNFAKQGGQEGNRVVDKGVAQNLFKDFHSLENSNIPADSNKTKKNENTKQFDANQSIEFHKQQQQVNINRNVNNTYQGNVAQGQNSSQLQQKSQQQLKETNNDPRNSQQQQPGKFSRLSEFFSDEWHREPQKEQLIEEKKELTQSNSAVSSNLSDERAHSQQFKFSLGNGLASEVFYLGDSTSLNDSSSYLLENLDKVNRLSASNGGISSTNNNKYTNNNQATVLTSPPNKNTSSNQYQQDKSSQFAPSPLVNDLRNLSLDFDEDDNSNAKEKQPNKKKTQFSKIKSADIFANEEKDAQSSRINSTIKEKLAGMAATAVAGTSNQFPSRQQAITQNLLKESVSKKNQIIHKPFSTPARKMSLHPQNNTPNLLQQQQQEEEQELERIVVRMPLNSYEKQVILSALTPGKISSNLFFKGSLEQHEKNQQHTDSSNASPTEDSTVLMENILLGYQKKIANCEKEIEFEKDRREKLISLKEKMIQEKQDKQKEFEEILNQPNEKELHEEGKQLKSQLNQEKLNGKQSQTTSAGNEQLKIAFELVTRYFGFEYLAKSKKNDSNNLKVDKNPKRNALSDVLSFRILHQFLVDIEVSRHKTVDHKIALLIVSINISPEVYEYQQSEQMQNQQGIHQMTSITSENRDDNDDIETQENTPCLAVLNEFQSLSNTLISRIVESVANQKYQNYRAHSGNLSEVLEYVACRIFDLQEFNRQMKPISRIFQLSNVQYSLRKLAFTLSLSHFPSKTVTFSTSTVSWYNDIQIKVNNDENLLPVLSDQIDQSINTQFNSKINAQASFGKLWNIIQAINVKYEITSHQIANDNSSIRLSNPMPEQ